MLDRELADNKPLVGGYILYFLENNSMCKEIKSDWMQHLYSEVVVKAQDKKITKEIPQSKNLVPMFMTLIFEEILRLKDSDKNQFKITLDKINQKDSDCLEGFYQLSLKYKIDPDELKKDFAKNLLKIKDVDDQRHALFYMLFQGIYHCVVIILSQVYKDWYNEKYEPVRI